MKTINGFLEQLDSIASTLSTVPRVLTDARKELMLLKSSSMRCDSQVASEAPPAKKALVASAEHPKADASEEALAGPVPSGDCAPIFKANSSIVFKLFFTAHFAEFCRRVGELAEPAAERFVSI